MTHFAEISEGQGKHLLPLDSLSREWQLNLTSMSERALQ
jgi:hypothetical protein